MSEDHRCYRARWCPDAERVDGHLLGAPINAERGLCFACERAATSAIAALPADYARLAVELGQRESAGGELVASTPELAVPLRLDVDALMTRMVHDTTTWAEPVAERLRTPWDTQAIARLRPGAALQAAVRLLTRSMPVLLALRNVPLVVWQDDERVAVDRDGFDGALDLAGLHRRAAHLVGLTRRTTRLPEPCPACGTAALSHVDGSHTVECGRCAYRMTWDQYRTATDPLLAGAAR